MQRFPITAALFLALVACGTQQPPTSQPVPPAAHHQAYLLSSDLRSISVADTGTGKQLRSLPLGAPAPDWSVLYTVASVSGGTEVRAIDTHTGSVLRRIAVPGTFHLPTPDMSGLPAGLSPDGHWLALSDQATGRSSFAVLDTSLKTAAQTVTLDGDFRYDAVNNNGDGLFLLEYVAGGHYRVRMYDLAAKWLDPAVIVDKREPDEAMNGTRITSLSSPTGLVHYGLYFRSNEAPFIHTLPLMAQMKFAWCVDLPAPTYQPSTFDWSLSETRGGRLYAASGEIGLVVELTPGDPPEVAHTLKLPGAPSSRSWLWTDAQAKVQEASSSAVLSPDEQFLYVIGRAGIVMVDARLMKVKSTWPVTTTIYSVAPTPDGKTLLALTEDGHLLPFDITTGKAGAPVRLPQWPVLRLLRVEASA